VRSETGPGGDAGSGVEGSVTRRLLPAAGSSDRGRRAGGMPGAR
jgi:hypothetical protein